MSTKPTTLPEWALTGAKSQPPIGMRNSGNVPNQAPLHIWDNWYKELVYQWTKWLDDGDVAFHNLNALNLTITGNTLLGDSAADGTDIQGLVRALNGPIQTFAGLAVKTGGMTVDNGNTVAVGNGATTLGGTLGVTGATSLNSTLGVTGLITATAGLTAAVNQHVTVSGTGKHKHGTITKAFSMISQGQAGTSTGYMTQGGFGSGYKNLGEIVPIGNRILAVRIYITDSVTGPTQGAWQFTSITPPSTSVTQLATSGLSAGSGAFQTMTMTPGAPVTVTAGVIYSVNCASGPGSASVTTWYGEVDYDNP